MMMNITQKTYSVFLSIVQLFNNRLLTPALHAFRSVGAWFTQPETPTLQVTAPPSPNQRARTEQVVQDSIAPVPPPSPNQRARTEQVVQDSIAPVPPQLQSLHQEYLKTHGNKASAASPNFKEWLRARKP